MGNPKEQSSPSFPEKNSSEIRILTVTPKKGFSVDEKALLWEHDHSLLPALVLLDPSNVKFLLSPRTTVSNLLTGLLVANATHLARSDDGLVYG